MSAQANAEKEAGNREYASMNFTEALSHYNAAVQLDPQNHVHYSNRSACFFSMNQLQEALQDSEVCIRLKPDFARGYLRKGKALFELKREKEAAEVLRKGLELDPGNETLQTALKACEDKKKNSIGEMFRGVKLERLKRHPKTAGFFSQPDFMQIVERVNRNPDDTAGLILDQRVMACFQVNLELELESIKSGAFDGINKMFKEGPLGDIMGKAGITPESLRKPPPKMKEEDINARAEEAKKRAEEAKVRGNEEYKARHFQEAIRHYDEAIALNSSEPVYYTNKAAALFELAQYQDCVDACTTAVTQGRKNGADNAKVSKAFVRKGNALRKLGQDEKALECFRDAVRITPDDKLTAEIREIEAKLAQTRPTPQETRPAYSEPTSMVELAEKCNSEGSAAFGNQHYSEAEQKYSEAIDLNAAEGKYWANRAAARYREGNCPGALRDIDKSLQLNPTVAKWWTRKGDIHKATTDFSKAVNAYSEALSRGSTESTLIESYCECARVIRSRLTPEAQAAAAHLLSQSDVVTVLEGSEGVEAAVTAPQTRDKITQLATFA